MPADKILTCRDCGQAFTFTTGEQEFFASRGFTNEPSRCPDCRAQRKARTDDGGYGGGWSSRGGGGGGSREPRQMFTAQCAACGGEAKVPFEPRGDKPVYCSSCFEQRSGTGSGGQSRSRGRY